MMTKSTAGMRPMLLLAALAVALPGAARAQTVNGLTPGARLHMHFRAAQEKTAVTARFVRLSGSTIWVQRAGAYDTTAVPISELSRLDVSLGRHSRTVAGAGVGLLVGAVGGALVGGMQGGDTTGSIMSMTAGEKAMFGGIIGALPGTLIGAMIGTHKRELWRRVRI